MATEHDAFFISSTGKILLNDFPELSNIIRRRTKYIKAIKEAKEGTGDSMPLLSDQELNDACHGPFHLFFHQTISAYMKIAQVRLAITLDEDDKLEPHQQTEHPHRISKKNIKKIDKSDLTKIERSLNDTLTTHNEQWDQLIKQWQHQLITLLNTLDCTLNELELKEFTDLEPLSELDCRYIDLNLKKLSDIKSDINFSDYLHQKLYLTIHSSLSRRHLAHTPSDIKTLLKKFKKPLATILEDNKRLSNQQNNELKEITHTIAF